MYTFVPSAFGNLKSFVGMEKSFWIELVLAQGGVLDIPLCVSYSLRIIVYCLYIICGPNTNKSFDFRFGLINRRTVGVVICTSKKN